VNARIQRYEISSFIGPCTEEEAIALAEAILELPEHKAVGGGGVGMARVADDDPLFADAPKPPRAEHSSDAA
jgi:hypothetical protein